jgi:hypothetical protein
MTTEGADQLNTITENTTDMGTDAGADACASIDVNKTVSLNVELTVVGMGEAEGVGESVSNIVEAGSSGSGNGDDTNGGKSKSKIVSQTGNGKKKSRSFRVKLDIDGDQYGRYNGESPYQAANKALSEIIRNKVKKEEPTDEEITFFLIESTKDSKKKIHQYLGKRTKLPEPVKYKVKNGDKEQEITKEYKNILRKIKKSEIDDNESDINETITEEKKKKKKKKSKNNSETEEVAEIKESKSEHGTEEKEKEKEKDKEKKTKNKSRKPKASNNMDGGNQPPDDNKDGLTV